MRRRLELEGEIERTEGLFIPVAPHEVERAALELVLLLEGSTARLTLESPTDVVRSERGKASRLATADGVHTLTLCERELDLVRALLISSYRDGPVPRNHIDLEIDGASAW